MQDPCFLQFRHTIADISLPLRFTYPFCYEPHPLAKIAASELQEFLEQQTDWVHDFGIDNRVDGTNIGKMFGVLVVSRTDGMLGYLAAFSGKLAGENNHPRFVPPIFDALQADGFFRIGEAHISTINAQIAELESSAEYLSAKAEYRKVQDESVAQLSAMKRNLKLGKLDRKQRRHDAKLQNTTEAYNTLVEVLKNESLKQQYDFKQATAYWNEHLLLAEQNLTQFTNQIQPLKLERKRLSGALQQKLFDQYQFLDQQKRVKNVCEIFLSTAQKVPPAGAGDCAAPKLLQYAFQHDLKPVALAEFWWGQSPNSEVRQHRNYYPACRGKCLPILGHMLGGMAMDPDPMLHTVDPDSEIEILHDEDEFLIINKPAELLSAPGKKTDDCVYSRMKTRFPNATGPLIVHRLDMSTSGLMIITKTKASHEILQKQFLERVVKKQYVALLDGVVDQLEGEINLPLRVDLEDRPRQLVCAEFGKPAKTLWKRIAVEGNRTRIYFYPVTGRTHQLRVHAAHIQGLNTPIVGDDLYGQKADRLCLHAESIEFYHPITNEPMKFTVAPNF